MGGVGARKSPADKDEDIAIAEAIHAWNEMLNHR